MPVPYTKADGTTGTDLYLSQDGQAAFAADLPTATSRLLQATRRPFDSDSFIYPTTAAAWKTIPTWALVAGRDKAIPPACERWMYHRAGGFRIGGGAGGLAQLGVTLDAAYAVGADVGAAGDVLACGVEGRQRAVFGVVDHEPHRPVHHAGEPADVGYQVRGRDAGMRDQRPYPASGGGQSAIEFEREQGRLELGVAVRGGRVVLPLAPVQVVGVYVPAAVQLGGDHLAETLLGRSAEFAARWSEHEVGVSLADQRKRLIHPELGLMELHCQVLLDPGQSQTLLVYTAPPGTESHEKLRLLNVIGAQRFQPGPPQSSD